MPAEPQQQPSGQAKTELTLDSGLLDRIVSEGRLGQNEEERKQGKEWVGAFLEEVMRDQMLVSKDTDAMIAARIAQLDELLSTQLNEIMHAPEFQTMEGSWGISPATEQADARVIWWAEPVTAGAELRAYSLQPHPALLDPFGAGHPLSALGSIDACD